MQNIQISDKLNESALRSLVANSINKCRTIKNADKVDVRYTINYVDEYKGNADHVSVILDNLISNGIKYQSKDVDSPYVDVFVASTPQKLKIKILDNGVGMDISENENIQLSMANDRKNDEQKKLGLYIVNEILQKNRGLFFVESVKNSGTMVLIELPNVKNSNNKNFSRYEHNNNN